MDRFGELFASPLISCKAAAYTGWVSGEGGAPTSINSLRTTLFSVMQGPGGGGRGFHPPFDSSEKKFSFEGARPEKGLKI